MATVAWHWSANGYLRNLDNTRMYPRDVNYPSWGTPEEHYTGEIWGGYLYDLYRVLGPRALKYVYQSFLYFDPSGGWMGNVGTYPDFYDAINAQVSAEYDLTGRVTSSLKAWGSMVSRGILGWLRSPYCHSSDYFYTGSPGCDDSVDFGWNFPDFRGINTKGNLLLTGDFHEYSIVITQGGWDLVATVKGMTNGIINPNIYLYGKRRRSAVGLSGAHR